MLTLSTATSYLRR